MAKRKSKHQENTRSTHFRLADYVIFLLFSPALSLRVYSTYMYHPSSAGDDDGDGNDKDVGTSRAADTSEFKPADCRVHYTAVLCVSWSLNHVTSTSLARRMRARNKGPSDCVHARANSLDVRRARLLVLLRRVNAKHAGRALRVVYFFL